MSLGQNQYMENNNDERRSNAGSPEVLPWGAAYPQTNAVKQGPPAVHRSIQRLPRSVRSFHLFSPRPW